MTYSGDDGTTEPGRASQRTGVELSNHYAPTLHWLMDLDLASTRARFTDADPAGRYIPEALNATVSAGVTARNIGAWTGSVFMRYFGPRALIESDSVRSPSTTLFNVQTTYRINHSFGLRFDVLNLLDTRAPDITYVYTSRLPGEPTAGVNDFHFHPVESRALRIGILGTF